jgi:hypothetical protein
MPEQGLAVDPEAIDDLVDAILRIARARFTQ